MKITWIGQSGYVISTDTTKIIIDPYLSDVVNKVANRPRLVDAPFSPDKVSADAIICSHDHLDHFDIDAVADMNRNLAFITTKDCKEKLNNMGFSRVTVLSVGSAVTVGDIKITAVYANHTVEAFGIILCAEGKTLYFSGDTVYDEKLFDIAGYSPDVTFICINGKLGNMNVSEAAHTAKTIGAKVNVPNHYGMFASNTEDPHLFTEKINNGFIMEFNREYEIEEILK